MSKQTLTYSAIGLTVCLLWFFFVYVPFHKEYRATNGQITNAESQLNDFQRTISELPRFIERQKNLLSLKNDLNSRLYTKKDVLKLFDRLQEEASAKHLSLNEITPPVEELLYLNSLIPDSGQPQFLNIGLKLEGDYVNFGKFVEVIEQADYFRGINLCKMYGHTDDNSKITLHLGFKALLGNLRDEG